MNAFQKRITVAISESPNGQSSASRLATILKKSSIAITSSLNCLYRQGYAGYLPPKDRWDCRHWYLTTKFEDNKGLLTRPYNTNDPRG